MKYAIAVIDVGKTNKKVIVYDDELRLLEERKTRIETFSMDGLAVEDVEQMLEWFLSSLKELAAIYPVRAISVSAHGATGVCVDANGQPSMPTVAYTNEVDMKIHRGFWQAVGSKDRVQRQTATAEIQPLINLGKLFWYMKQRWPKRFKKTDHVLFFPQFFTYCLTGIPAADITYTGSHSYLWDFVRHDWSWIVDILEIRKMLPQKPGLPYETLGPITKEVADRTGLSSNTLVTYGAHDSSSSMIPYLITQKEDFVLNSTGTWCVAMHLEKSVQFEDDEIGKMIFYNLSFRGEPVRTSMFLGGLEYETWTELIMERHGRQDIPVAGPEVYADIFARKECFVLPSVVQGSGFFPESSARVVEQGRVLYLKDVVSREAWPACFEEYERAFALVKLSVAIQSSMGLKSVGIKRGYRLFVEGGFRQNVSYLSLLSGLLPDNPIFTTSIKEASSLGVALCCKAMLDEVPLESLAPFVDLNQKPVETREFEGLQDYAQRFLEVINT